MKFFILFAAALACAHAVHLPYIISNSFESSEEEYRVLLPAKGQSLPGVGVINQPVVQAVKVKVPRYVSPDIKQQIIRQSLAARGYGGQILTAASGAGAPQAATLLR
ncbi:uncharacterized protein LOC105209948 [Zeugodacus cucurbitae]|uniref:Probable histone-lysine N-methyltransferase set-2 n=1 Tax=Zeugodacus cucurbitae TaxID=28588 RepID=A0A0A1XJ22_ZEUCU|nr:uncharacterized protein LOC105209948 [Zeugodacus cucurbitae]